MALHYGLILDGLVAVLLVITIGYAFVLNRKLSRLRANRAEIEQVIADLTQAVTRADQSMKSVKGAAEEAGRIVDTSVKNASALRDELAFLVERADGLAGNLADGISRSRGAQPKASAAAAAAPPPSGRPASQDQAMEEAPRRPRPSAARPSGPVQTAAAGGDGEEDREQARSKAERDLMEALKGIR